MKGYNGLSLRVLEVGSCGLPFSEVSNYLLHAIPPPTTGNGYKIYIYILGGEVSKLTVC